MAPSDVKECKHASFNTNGPEHRTHIRLVRIENSVTLVTFFKRPNDPGQTLGSILHFNSEDIPNLIKALQEISETSSEGN